MKPNLTYWKSHKSKLKKKINMKVSFTPEPVNYFNFLIFALFLIILFTVFYIRYKEKKNRKQEKNDSILKLINNVNYYTNKF